LKDIKLERLKLERYEGWEKRLGVKVGCMD